LTVKCRRLSSPVSNSANTPRPMQLYAGTSRDFISDATRNGIASKLEHAFVDAFHYKPSMQEVQSWQNSLFRMAFALQEGAFTDHGVLLEYQLPLTSRRLDCMVTGHSTPRSSSSTRRSLGKGRTTLSPTRATIFGRVAARPCSTKS